MLNLDAIVTLQKKNLFEPTLATPLPNIKHHKFGITEFHHMFKIVNRLE
jgi:hypothetical protein